MKLSFKPKAVTKSLLSVLKDRARDVVERRYGLFGDGKEQMTLEAIGQIYGITRERVRQIENISLESIRKSDAYQKAGSSFEELEDLLTKHGGLVKEEDFLREISPDESIQNHVNFLLIIGESFIKLKEDDHFHHRWTVDEKLADQVHQSLHGLHEELTPDILISEGEIILKFLDHLKRYVEMEVSEEHAKKWLRVSKKVAANPLGEWGLADSPNIKTRGVRDLAYLVLRQNKEPMHFSEVAEEISKLFDRKAHVATTHNELIKDGRFVLVGRGLYALSEWGYSNGVVRDVIRDVLKKKGPLTKPEVISEVLKQRHVKENTIYVNLQNSRYFKKDPKGRYVLAHE